MVYFEIQKKWWQENSAQPQLQNTLQPFQSQKQKNLQAIRFTHFAQKFTSIAYFATFSSLKDSKMILNCSHYVLAIYS